MELNSPLPRSLRATFGRATFGLVVGIGLSALAIGGVAWPIGPATAAAGPTHSPMPAASLRDTSETLPHQWLGLGPGNPEANAALPRPLSVAVTAPHDRVRHAERFTYTLHYTNTTGEAIPDAVITSALSAGQTYAGPYESEPTIPSGQFTFDPVSRVLMWSLGLLPGGSAGHIDVYVIVTATPAADRSVIAVGCSARLSSTGADVPADEALAQAMVVGPLFDLRKTADAKGLPGRPIHYTLTLAALGPAAGRPDAVDGTSVVITERLPISTTLLSVSPPGTLVAPRELQWPLAGAVSPGTTTVVTFSARADSRLIAGAGVVNPEARYAVRAHEFPGRVYGKTAARTVIEPLVEATVKTGRFVGGRAEAYPGETVTYTLIVRNPEPAALTGVSIEIDLPANTAPGTAVEEPYITFGTALGGTPAPEVGANGNLRWPSVNLPAWGETALEFSAHVSRRTYTLNRSGGWQYKLARVSAAHPSTSFLAFLDRSAVAVVPAVTMDKTVLPATTLIRMPVTYTLTVRNVSPYLVSGIRVTDTIRPIRSGTPMSFTHAGTIEGPEPNETGIAPWVWSDIDIEPGATVKMVYSAIADGAISAQYASDLDASTPDTAIPNVRGRALVTIDSPVAVSLAVTPTETFLDSPVTYDLTVRNVDTRTYHLSEVQADVPAGVRLLTGGTMFSQTLAPPVMLENGDEWQASYGAVAGETLACRDLPTNRGVGPLGVRAALTELPAYWFGNRQGTASLRIVPQISTAITATREMVLPGGAFTYTIRLDNRSTQSAAGLTITLRLPKDFLYESMASGPAPEVSGSPADGLQVRWAGVDIAADSAVTWHARAVAGTKPGRYTVTLGEAGLGRVCVENRVGGRVDVLEPGASLIRLTKSVSEPTVPPGGSLGYTVSFNNVDRDPVRLSVVTDTLPAGFQFVRMMPGAGAPPPPRIVGQDLLWRDVTVAGRATRRWSYEVRAPSMYGIEFENLVRAASAAFPITGTAYASVDVVPQVILSKVAGAQSAVPGQTVPYTITIVSNSRTAYAGLRVTDTLPAALVFVRPLTAGMNPISLGANQREPAWRVDLAAGRRIVIAFEARVVAAPAPGVHYNRLDGYSSLVTIPGIERAAPITVTGVLVAPTPSQSPTPPTATPTPGTGCGPAPLPPCPPTATPSTTTPATQPGPTVPPTPSATGPTHSVATLLLPAVRR